MNTTIKYKDLLLCILANLMFLLHAFNYEGYVHITVIHFFCGIVPLIFSVKKHFGHLVKI